MSMHTTTVQSALSLLSVTSNYPVTVHVALYIPEQFAQQVLCPAMGWTQNYHAYAFRRRPPMLLPAKSKVGLRAIIDPLHWLVHSVDTRSTVAPTELSHVDDVTQS
jgi:hypothetical protein